MDGIQQVALPVLGIVAAAAVTFYAVSFSELREVPSMLQAFLLSISNSCLAHFLIRFSLFKFWICRNLLKI
jgi:hypothetical protein